MYAGPTICGVGACILHNKSKGNHTYNLLFPNLWKINSLLKTKLQYIKVSLITDDMWPYFILQPIVCSFWYCWILQAYEHYIRNKNYGWLATCHSWQHINTFMCFWKVNRCTRILSVGGTCIVHAVDTCNIIYGRIVFVSITVTTLPTTKIFSIKINVINKVTTNYQHVWTASLHEGQSLYDALKNLQAADSTFRYAFLCHSFRSIKKRRKKSTNLLINKLII